MALISPDVERINDDAEIEKLLLVDFDTAKESGVDFVAELFNQDDDDIFRFNDAELAYYGLNGDANTQGSEGAATE